AALTLAEPGLRDLREHRPTAAAQRRPNAGEAEEQHAPACRFGHPGGDGHRATEISRAVMVVAHERQRIAASADAVLVRGRVDEAPEFVGAVVVWSSRTQRRRS